MQFIDAKLTNNHPNQLTFKENDANQREFSELYSLRISSIALLQYPVFTPIKVRKGFTAKRCAGELKNRSLINICDFSFRINLSF